MQENESRFLQKETQTAQEHLIEHLLCSGPEEELAATFAFTVSRSMRKIINHPWFCASGLLEPTGGDDHNPHREIDTIAGDLGRHLVQRFVAQNNTTVSLYIEENHAWHQLGVEPVSRLVVIDPIDGTSLITAESVTASSGMMILDEKGKFIAGAITSLADGRIVVISEGKANRFMYNYETGQIRREDPDSMLRHEQKLRIAALPRRIAEMQPMFDQIKNMGYELEVIRDFGGYALLDVLFPIGAPIHAMLDLKKGQKLYEPWGYLAHESGLLVRGPKGEIPDFAYHYRSGWEMKDMNSRIQYGVYRNQKAFDILAPFLS